MNNGSKPGAATALTARNTTRVRRLSWVRVATKTHSGSTISTPVKCSHMVSTAPALASTHHRLRPWLARVAFRAHAMVTVAASINHTYTRTCCAYCNTRGLSAVSSAANADARRSATKVPSHQTAATSNTPATADGRRTTHSLWLAVRYSHSCNPTK